MLDTKDFSFFEDHNHFDFKGFLLKALSYWKWFLASWIIAFIIAYQVNIRKQKIYALETTISVKEESNPFFTSNTSLVFNWGGTSDQVQTIISTLKSRSHNELVVSKLEFYISYLKKGDYDFIDAYGEVPFYINPDKVKGQLLNQNIKIKFLSEKEYEIIIPFETDNVSVIHYSDNTKTNTAVVASEFKRKYKVGEKVVLPFLNWTLEINDNPGFYTNGEYYVNFKDFDATVASYQNINADVDIKGSSIVKLSLQGNNKARIVKYLNTTVQVLKDNQLAAKNQFATNTIAFIDSTLNAVQDQIKTTRDELNSFVKEKNVIQIEEGGTGLSSQLLDLDVKKDEIARKINYYNSLKSYLKNSVDFSRLPAPSVAGIEDPNIVVNVSKLISLSTQRSELQYAVKSDKIFRDFDNQMEAIKSVLMENIASAKSNLQYELNIISSKINQSESTMKKLPEDKQMYLGIKRKFDLSDNIYTSFLQKRSEADIVKAANVSDIRFIDTAKDTGGGLIGPKTSVNYILALFLGFLFPLLFVFALFLINNNIQNTEDITKLTQLPIIGVIGKKTGESNLAVFEKPKSALSESFRSIRSSLQFLYKKQNINGTKILMITSSISGEGKTFCSINIATVFALSEKKTIIIGLDLRKPKIFDDFEIKNNIGITNYLIGENTISEVIQQTHVPFLDVLPSGPIPPNPAELIMSNAMKEMFDELKNQYDYIIIDTPPIGLVSDAFELAVYADLILFIVRQNYTRKDMIALLNNKTKREELKSVSIIFNGFENKARYGYGYAYGYGNYGNGYYEIEEKKSFLGRWIQRWKSKHN
ncbi:MAG TPA: polysaccharide biosynthesis tyrosine autokinase [Flavobacterium sp.]|jgi:capsular exopolysaccharide synthesis family protein